MVWRTTFSTPPRLMPAELVLAGEGDLHRDPDLLARRQALEVDVDRPVGDRVQLHLAHQGADRASPRR